MKIVVTDAFLVKAGNISWEPLRRLGTLELYDDTTPEQLPERIADADAVFTNRVRFPAPVFDSAPKLRMIGTFGTGVDFIDIKAARAHNVAVCNVPRYGHGAVAQMAIALMFEVLRNTSVFDDIIKNVGWENPNEPAVCDIRQMELTGKTMGIIGMGDIGYAIAKVAMAMDMQVLGYRRNPVREWECDQLSFVDLDTLLEKSDIISLNSPLTESTRGIINKDTIAKMKDGVVLINASRGALFNTADVVEALDSGKVYGVGADVFDPEPCGKNHPLATHPRCVATPHVAWAPVETRQNLVNKCAANLQALLEGRPQNVTNP